MKTGKVRSRETSKEANSQCPDEMMVIYKYNGLGIGIGTVRGGLFRKRIE